MIVTERFVCFSRIFQQFFLDFSSILHKIVRMDSMKDEKDKTIKLKKKKVGELIPQKSADQVFFYDVSRYSDFPMGRYIEYYFDDFSSHFSLIDLYKSSLINYLELSGKLLFFSSAEQDSNRTEEEEALGDLYLTRRYGHEEAADERVYLYNDVLINARKEHKSSDYKVTCFFATKNSDKFQQVKSILNKYKSEKKITPKVSLLLKDMDLTFSSINLSRLEDFDVATNYGEDFLPIHEKIIEKLSTYLKGGIYTFRGDPGTGKSTYIKYLTEIVNREFIFIPANMVNELTDPSFTNLLLGKKGAVLVIEDAENAIMKRESGSYSLVSNLLNLSDGLLAEAIQLSIILTYNCEIDKIDQALLRKGRLIVDHEFAALSIKESQKLIDKLKIDYEATEPMTLADIFNLNWETNYKEKEEEKRIGFLP